MFTMFFSKMSFVEITNKYELADFFQVELKKLTFFLYKLNSSQQYKIRFIKKMNGGRRKISIPILPLKNLQRQLKKELYKIYTPKICVHGYVYDRGIKTNALKHEQQGWIANIDIENFFASINFGRVRGMFISKPFSFPDDIATILGKLCTHENELPQGAPTSPIISNIICRRLDREFISLAKRNRCVYTRYSDDMTISTSKKVFPTSICSFDHDHSDYKVKIGDEAKAIIENNGFAVNNNKVRLKDRCKRQMVTGIVVNKHINVKREYIDQIRMMLHCWEKYGFGSSQKRFLKKYDNKNRLQSNHETRFRQVLLGRIQYVGSLKGWDDLVYLNLSKKFANLDHRDRLVENIFEFNKRKLVPKTSFGIRIYCEGKTDLKHLKAAFEHFRSNREFTNLPLKFEDSNHTSGSSGLLKKCKEQSRQVQDTVCVCIFDRDELDKLKEVTDSTGEAKDWGKNVFSFAIDYPNHREKGELICIEHLYQDIDLLRKDTQERRLFLISEFSKHNGFHKKEKFVLLNPKRKTIIVDSDVFHRETGNSFALSKDSFADYIQNKTIPFDKIDFSGFKSIFITLEKIALKVMDNSPKRRV